MTSAIIIDGIKSTILEFIKDLRLVIVDSSIVKDLFIAELAFQKMDATTIADHVVSYLLPHKNKIVGRDLSFFSEQRYEIFKGLPRNKIDHILDVINGGTVAQADIDVVWSYFQVLLNLTEEYKKKK